MTIALSYMPSVRADLITRRTYSRPDEWGGFETWLDTVDRVIGHQAWLWRRAKQAELTTVELDELNQLRALMMNRKAMPAGRTLWLGGTNISQTREASMFNCSFLRVETVHDVVDSFWLLLQGCGVGFEPVVGTLSGFTRPVEIEIIRSTKCLKDPRGCETNTELVVNTPKGKHWIVKVGDSAEAWAKSIGKILANKQTLDKLTIDFSEVRAAGERLKGYGWISSGDETISVAFEKIAILLNKKAGVLLSRMDILDILNHLGTTLSSRRSAEIALVPYGDPEWVRFAKAKENHWIDNPQRAQSNNSLVFYHKPTKEELTEVMDLIVSSGGSEPGFINGQAALERAPWFKGVNPCAEILLANKSFCNLCEIDLGKFNGDYLGLLEAVKLIARANYRQTCVNLDDGLLQRSWHELNEFLRLSGVGLTGIVRWEHSKNPEKIAELYRAAVYHSYGMADNLKLPRSKAVTTIKPSGTLSKIMDTTEGIHKPLGRYIFNNVRFSKNDELIGKMRDAGYHIFDDPYSNDTVLVRFPVAYTDVDFEFVNGIHVNLESAVDQLERYKLYMENYVQHNASITVSYDPSEVSDIVDWLLANWDCYVGVSFLFRNDPTKTAEDLGYPYLPQEVVSQQSYENYVKLLKPISLDGDHGDYEDDGCATGACPIK